MTTIAAVVDKDDAVYMGADSLVSGGCAGTVRRDTKIVKRGNMLIGVSGDIRLEQVIRYAFAPVGRGSDDPEDMAYLAGTWIPALRRLCEEQGIKCESPDGKDNTLWHLLIGYRGCLYEVDDDFQVIAPATDYAAIGCGADVALGSLYTTSMYCLRTMGAADRVRVALEAASEHDLHTRGPIFIDGVQ